MPAKKIFYAWQSDRPPEVTRGFIRDAIVKAIEKINAEAEVEDADDIDRYEIDHDTKGSPGSPPIAETICQKIDNCAIFIADVTFVGQYLAGGRTKLIANSNVLLELGYARASRGLSRIIAIQNLSFGAADGLPFDLRHLRHPVPFDLAAGTPEPQKKKIFAELVNIVATAIGAVLDSVDAAEEQKRAQKETEERLATASLVTARKTEFQQVFHAFLKRIREGEFHGLPSGKPVIALAIYPLEKPRTALELGKLEHQLNSGLRPIGAGQWDHRHRATSFVTLAYQRGEQGNILYSSTAAEITNQGVIFAACVMSPSQISSQPLILLYDEERQVFLAAAKYLSLLVQFCGQHPPFLGSLAVLGVRNYFFAPYPHLPLRDGHRIDAEEIQPEQVEVSGGFDTQEIVQRSLYPAFNEIWREAGYPNDPIYGPDGKPLK